MKINPMAAFHAYNKAADYTRLPHPEEGTEAARPSGKTDRVQISPEASHRQEVDQLSRSISAQIQAPASPQRLESLRQAVQNHTYRIPTEDLVDAVMKKWLLV